MLCIAMFSLSQRALGAPALWSIEDTDTRISLLGSVHVLKPGTVWLNDDIQALISTSDVIYLELSPQDQSPQVMQPLVMKYGLLAEGDALKKHLPESLYADLSKELMSLGMPEQNFARLKPWTVGTMYSAVKFMKLGFNPAAGVEATVISLAQAKGVPMKGLETAEFQIRLFDSLTDEQEIAFLEQTLADKDELPATMESITTAWTTGNTVALEELFEEAFDGHHDIKNAMLTDRNKTWAPQIAAMLDQPGNFFVVVGTGHLVGKGSVIELLKQENIRVQLIH